ncbi:hypothetical protein SASPL_150523 [Salvia splendens]|uniref:Uncharacterized protein n=1 Tax=Salvia splendens TaxID=180675 RepID=A0A8X8Z2Q8_SALSN|nr:hypothetical protein SASPL_150513 [Salvia splendens]KAG6389064.1 hypothetical protein SASPL_150523 [Salvia splendens]
MCLCRSHVKSSSPQALIPVQKYRISESKADSAVAIHRLFQPRCNPLPLLHLAFFTFSDFPMLTAGTYNIEKGLTMKGKGTKRESSSSNLDSQEPRMDIKSILKDIEFLGKIKSLYIYYYYNPICWIFG